MKHKLRDLKWRLKWKFRSLVKFFTFDDVKWSMAHAMYNEKVTNSIIHRVIIIPFWRKLHIFVWLERPGIFIGLNGVTYDKIKNYIETCHKKEVVFHLKERRPLPTVYNLDFLEK